MTELDFDKLIEAGALDKVGKWTRAELDALEKEFDSALRVDVGYCIAIANGATQAAERAQRRNSRIEGLARIDGK